MLYFLPTPIGNLSDITLRTLEVLERSEVLLCEDTRVSKRLLHLLAQNPVICSSFPKIATKERKFIAFHSHNDQEFLEQVELSFFDKEIAVMSDAGMPSLSDPCMSLVVYALKHNIKYDVLPGANALTTAFCASGFLEGRFFYAGFLPHKSKERRLRIVKILNALAYLEEKTPIVFYESPHRILETLRDLESLAQGMCLFVAKELTKLHQRYYFGRVSEVFLEIQKGNIQGEWVLVLLNERMIEPCLGLSALLELDLPPKIKAKIEAIMTHKNAKELYQQAFAKTSEAQVKNNY
ncbi:16S rRNA (cytidine(1402)-2'-O)-methyltransferase [Helicobacter cetorum]|uniref:Ribosomal RNA small subunit methyltransferase I n=1 Tax=Helicobacter cetorum (strain ATCC BAA-540 / CCUG 52418 / MIT 99-5656) TaxID=1163745 RepID=I0ET18_HELCM|nr:16S rRNA (cytidine(1402)-2'-O)-methyltransferase [Helicobacter cetorum]AFI06087.1 methylase [Helicobacter cetorum MIT 99-5656]